jgi:hypothetical protein
MQASNLFYNDDDTMQNHIATHDDIEEAAEHHTQHEANKTVV